jgi:hypothetical protein
VSEPTWTKLSDGVEELQLRSPRGGKLIIRRGEDGRWMPECHIPTSSRSFEIVVGTASKEPNRAKQAARELMQDCTEFEVAG